MKFNTVSKQKQSSVPDVMGIAATLAGKLAKERLERHDERGRSGAAVAGL
jgi:hypothetical protein